MPTTRIHVHNRTKVPTSNKVLMFLQPVVAQENYLYSAWNVLNPSRGSTQSAVLSTDYSGSIATWGDTHGNYSDPVALTLGKELTISNPNQQSPIITDLVHPNGRITANQVGLFNNAITPPTKLSVTWYVNGRKVVETNNTNTTTLNPGFNATFELKQSVYLMWGQQPTVTETYTFQTFSETVQIKVPNNATDLYIEGYTDENGVDTFRVVEPNAFAAMEAEDTIALLQNELGQADRTVTGWDPITNVRIAGPTYNGFVGTGWVQRNAQGLADRLSCGTFPYQGHTPVVGQQYTLTYDLGPGQQGGATMRCTVSGEDCSFEV